MVGCRLVKCNKESWMGHPTLPRYVSIRLSNKWMDTDVTDGAVCLHTLGVCAWDFPLLSWQILINRTADIHWLFKSEMYNSKRITTCQASNLCPTLACKQQNLCVQYWDARNRAGSEQPGPEAGQTQLESPVPCTHRISSQVHGDVVW